MPYLVLQVSPEGIFRLFRVLGIYTLLVGFPEALISGVLTIFSYSAMSGQGMSELPP